MLRRLDTDVERVVELLARASERQQQLRAALVKSREEIERLRGEVQRYKRERLETRRRVDALLKRFESLEIDWNGAEP